MLRKEQIYNYVFTFENDAAQEKQKLQNFEFETGIKYKTIQTVGIIYYAHHH